MVEELGVTGLHPPPGGPTGHSPHELDARPPEAAYLCLSCHTCGGEGVTVVRVVGVVMVVEW